MARRAWLLVEWVDENNVFPSYGVVNIDTLAYKQIDLSPGQQIFLSLKSDEPKWAKIIRMADNKQQVQEHKEFLERQDRQVKNVLQVCMRTIKEMKSEPFMSTSESSQKQVIASSQQDNKPTVISVLSENSASDNESDSATVKSYTRKHHSYAKRASHPQQKNIKSRNHRSPFPAVNQKHRSMICSTPLPEKRTRDNSKLFLDQGTQTDDSLMQPPLEKINEIESVLKHLYERFQSLVTKVHNFNNVSLDISITEQHDDVSTNPTNNGSWVQPNNTKAEETGDASNYEKIDEAGNQNGLAAEATDTQNNIDDKIYIKNEKSVTENTSRVRRMSAQTTNSMELVPIGDGKAMVPARLLNDIDWNSYTSATRQLLQAIFSRKVLATHSLTGKQSPAHLNKPAKKVLDPHLVNDIVRTVSTRCGVAKNLVRNSITVKCTDEAKLYRNRQRHQQAVRAEKNRQNDENVPPSQTPSSDELTNVVS